MRNAECGSFLVDGPGRPSSSNLTGGSASTKVVDQDERPGFLSLGRSFFVDGPGRPSLSNLTPGVGIDKDCRPGRTTRFSEFGTFLLCRRSWSTVLVESHP